MALAIFGHFSSKMESLRKRNDVLRIGDERGGEGNGGQVQRKQYVFL